MNVNVEQYVKAHLAEGEEWPAWRGDSPSASYPDLVAAMGLETVQSRDFGSYQGDTITLVKEGDRYGVLVFGWGSCSGCDALEACYTWAEVDQLACQLYEGITWSPDRAGIRAIVTNADKRNDWYIHDGEMRAFMDELASWAAPVPEDGTGGAE